MARPRILFITRNFPPLTGGMERLNHQAYLALQHQFEVILCGPLGSCKFTKGAPTAEFTSAPAWRYLLGSLFQAIKLGFKFKPDLIYSGSGLAAHAAMLVGYLTKKPVIIYLHGLDIIAPNWIYQTFFLPIIRKADMIIVNSVNTAKLAIHAGILENKIHIIHPGVTLPNISHRIQMRDTFRSTLEVGHRPIILAAGRLTARKGLVEFIEQCMPEIISNIPDTCLLIIGEFPKHALTNADRHIAERIQAAVIKNQLTMNVRMLGKVDDETLSAAYFAADLFIFPVLDFPGDVEGFGMVAIEAAAHGLPTAGFAVGGVPDAVAQGVSGGLVAANQYPSLAKLSIGILHNKNISAESCITFASGFAWTVFNTKLLAVCQTLIKKTKL